VIREGWGAVVCVASGPSFTVEQAELIAAARAADRCRVIVVNDNWRRLPGADILYAGDGKWFDLYVDKIRAASFSGELWTQDHAASEKHGLHHIESKCGNELLSRDDHRITQGQNSGFQAIMLARLFGARTVVLCGFDMMRGPHGEKHWFGAHPLPLSNGDPTSFRRNFEAVALGLKAEGTRVVNCSAVTALTCFERADLATTLSAL
jgi:hypothetical protein